MEIERKFLVVLEKLPLKAIHSTPITQGYLSLDPMVRVRLSGKLAVGSQLTVKGKGLISREEWNFPIDRDAAQKMLTMCRYKLEKVRHRYPQASAWEVDQFQGSLKGLWIAEIELDSEDQKFVKPEWIGEEVSNDPRYQNVNLARSGKIPGV